MRRSEYVFRVKIGLLVGLWFAVIYGGADYAMRDVVNLPSTQTRWDALVPFWPSFALVYLSVTPFLCLPLVVLPDRLSVWTLAVTLMAETVVAAAIFILFPVASPEMPLGPHPALLQVADAINLRLNNLPSLHVALTVTAGLAMWPHLRGLRGLVAGWAVLICLSTLLTRQHDLASFAAGLFLAAAGHWAIAPLFRAMLSARG